MGNEEEPGLKAGSLFAAHYRILRLLGEGDRKRTYLAEDTLLPRRVAVSLIKPSAAQLDPGGTRREAEALAQAGTHDSVVTFHEWGIVEGTEYLVFDYLQGGTLREYLAKRTERGKPLSAEEVMRLGRQLARALIHVHRLGLIHRDVAPGNVWLDENQAAHLGDFDSAVSGDEALDPAGLPPTTETYAAPEQVAGGQFDKRVDLYSLGAVLFEALTGERPARAPKAIATRLRALRPDIPRSLGQAVSRLLAESPDERPSSAEEVLETLKSGHVYHAVDERLTAWADTLPFPLASILWHFEGEPDPAAKVDYLLKFFEALAEFAATVLLSACISDRAFFDASRLEWLGGGERRTLDLRVATFGTWVELSGRLAETLRYLLQDEDGADRCRQLFTDADLELVEALTSTELAGILHHALNCRNNWIGHGGVAGQHVHRERLGELENRLTQTQAMLGWTFEAWTLLQPGPMTFSRGVFDLTATILKGPNPAFRRKQIKVTEALDLTHLSLLHDGSTRALELVPFIRILTGTTGQAACYFYNRLEGNAVRWVSYHFHAEPELVTADEELADLLANLVPPESEEGAGKESAPGTSPRKDTRQPKADRLLYEYCQRCGYPFAEPTTQKYCTNRSACDRRLREPGYRVPKGRRQDIAIRNATIVADSEIGPQRHGGSEARRPSARAPQ